MALYNRWLYENKDDFSFFVIAVANVSINRNIHTTLIDVNFRTEYIQLQGYNRL